MAEPLLPRPEQRYDPNTVAGEFFIAERVGKGYVVLRRQYYKRGGGKSHCEFVRVCVRKVARHFITVEKSVRRSMGRLRANAHSPR